MSYNRRRFLERVAQAGAASVLSPWAVQMASAAAGTTGTFNRPPLVAQDPFPSSTPTPAQQAWMDMKSGLFIHFGINTYYDTEWSDGTLDISKFNPTQLDTDQWCRAAKRAGMKYLVLVTKHHDGFCNWPTKYTNYSVAHTPYKNDLVGAVVNSARKHGLKVGFYYSLWDRHEKSHDTNEGQYIAFMMKQLEELLTNYGPVVELWFDGFWKKQHSGWTGKIEGENVSREITRDEDFINSWRNEGAFRWQMDYLYSFIKSLQPDCLVMNNSTTAYPGVPLHPVDIRSGEKATKVMDDKKVWDWLGEKKYMPLQIETTLSQKGGERFKSGSWFWHEWDDSVASQAQIKDWLAIADKMEANLLLNAGPDPKGLLRPQDYKALMELRN